MSNDVKWLETARHLVVTYKDLDPCTLVKGSEKHLAIQPLLKEKKFGEIVSILFPGVELKETLHKESKGKFRLDGHGDIYVPGEKNPVHKVVGKKILEFHKNKLNYQPLVRFWDNLKLNPSEDSKNQLFAFLKANHHPITQDGHFIAYKYVYRNDNGKLVDDYTKTLRNDIGCVVKVDRSKVDPNPNQTCSRGLHVAAYDFAKGHKVVVEVKVNPRDVVAVPPDYNQQKMRVCEYKVVALSTGQISKSYVSLDEISEKQMASKTEEKKVIKDHKKVQKKIKKEEKKEKNLRDKKKQLTISGKNVKLGGASSSIIIDMVLNLTDKKITCSPKSKRSVIRQATDFLKKAGYKVSL